MSRTTGRWKVPTTPMLAAASNAFEHIGIQLAVVFDEWKDNGADDDELAWCAYLLSFAGWWSGHLQAAADVANRRVVTPPRS